MSQDKQRILIKDHPSPITNSRIKYIEENDKKIKGRKGFLFGSFKTEKERIVYTSYNSFRKKQSKTTVG